MSNLVKAGVILIIISTMLTFIGAILKINKQMTWSSVVLGVGIGLVFISLVLIMVGILRGKQVATN